jgi:hypothetical protein
MALKPSAYLLGGLAVFAGIALWASSSKATPHAPPSPTPGPGPGPAPTPPPLAAVINGQVYRLGVTSAFGDLRTLDALDALGWITHHGQSALVASGMGALGHLIPPTTGQPYVWDVVATWGRPDTDSVALFSADVTIKTLAVA